MAKRKKVKARNVKITIPIPHGPAITTLLDGSAFSSGLAGVIFSATDVAGMSILFQEIKPEWTGFLAYLLGDKEGAKLRIKPFEWPETFRYKSIDPPYVVLNKEQIIQAKEIEIVASKSFYNPEVKVLIHSLAPLNIYFLEQQDHQLELVPDESGYIYRGEGFRLVHWDHKGSFNYDTYIYTFYGSKGIIRKELR